MVVMLAAPDKFRGTASAESVAAAAARGARDTGCDVEEIPMSDGGEGLAEIIGGEVHHTTVSGPLGDPTVAEWRLIQDLSLDGESDSSERVPTAVVDMSEAAGRKLLPAPVGKQPLEASTAGVGELINAAIDAGAKRVIVGCGGSATSDGGLGALKALKSNDMLDSIDLIVATDVTTLFVQAAEVFAPQKGATPEQVGLLKSRLVDLAQRYRDEFGVDVGSIPGSGAAGGLAGGLAALGATIVSGFDLVAGVRGLAGALKRADFVMTGEGRLDTTSFAGKVVGQVIRVAGAGKAVLCIVGSVDPSTPPIATPNVTTVNLERSFGLERALNEVPELVEATVADYVSSHRLAR